MILFACHECGMKFQVKDEFAGRSTKCPTCKQSLVVPTPDATRALVPADHIDGASSSLHQAGVDAGITVDQTQSYAPKDATSVAQILAGRTKKDERYILESEIARGGMGAVLRAVDCDLRREVAVKFLLDQADTKKKVRFIEEAQITGQLEHPNIVPIHEIGVDRQKRLFFSMKMVQGRSLGQVIEELRKDPHDAEKKYPLSRLLTIFVNICHALAYAHSRHVIHRDLKPANVMIGEFGEAYVMDWGLAKVLRGEHTAEDANAAAQYFASLTEKSAAKSARVSTTKDDTDMLTQEGAIVGTPAYMPPEQAHGNLKAIDERSDIYSLGAILYAILTLESPVERGGDQIALLRRVAQGEISPPEERTPRRNIPPELSAIAMKALAKEQKNRYQTVETLRRDIELYLAGRSVSAKQDTVREQLWKLIKRNKAVSIATSAALVILTVVLAVAFQINYAARVEAVEEKGKAVKAYANFKTAQEEKEAAVRRSVPALVRAGKQLANENRIDLAEQQVTLALAYDAKNPDALLLKGQIHIARKQWPAAKTEMESYLRQRPRDHETILMVDAITNGKPDDGPTLLTVIESLQRQKVPGLAAPLLPDLEKIVAAKAKLLPVYQQQIESRWKGFGGKLALEKDGEFRLGLRSQNQLVDLTPLQGMKLNWLELFGCRQIKDLEPLRGMPLHFLDLGQCQMETLAPLRGMPLKSLLLQQCEQISDLEPLTGMKLTVLDLANCSKVRDLGPLQGMALESLNLGHCDLIVDLSPLRGQPLKTLRVTLCSQVNSLEPLRGMPLTKLYSSGLALVRDLSPLRKMPLTELGISGCDISDLEPLRGMPLTFLDVAYCPRVKNLEPLRDMPLIELKLTGDPVQNLEPLRGMPLKRLNIHDCKIEDLSPLEGLPLQSIILTPRLIEKNIEVLRNMKSLTAIQVGVAAPYTQAEFWQRYDKGEFKK